MTGEASGRLGRMSSIKTHNRDFFYKYFDFEGAKKTLENRTFLYKAPAFFNDPFDSQLKLQPGISEEEMGGMLFDALAEAILDRRAEPRLGLTAEVLATLPLDLTRETLYGLKRDLLTQLASGYFVEAHRQAAEGQSKYFQDNFVFCVTETNDNLLMWSHYANEHTGVVFKIKCIEEKQSLLCGALKVKYEDRYPIYGTANDWKNLISSGLIRDRNKLYNDLILTKSSDWRYEKEWRMVFPRPEDGGKKFVLLCFHPEEIESIFLGCRISEENKIDLMALVKNQYPWVKVFQARKSETEFRLHFDEIF